MLSNSRAHQSPMSSRDPRSRTARRAHLFNTASRARRASHTLHKGARMLRQRNRRPTQAEIKERRHQGDHRPATDVVIWDTFAGTAPTQRHEGQADKGVTRRHSREGQVLTERRGPAGPEL